jgi:cytidylate kinase
MLIDQVYVPARTVAMPLVAMTREMGSLGREIAARLSERLRKRLIHHEIIDQLASKMRLRQSHVIRFLDGKSGVWERLTTDKTSLAIFTASETLDLAESGEVGVIHGWGAAHLLRWVPHVVCVRVCAPRTVRVRRMMEHLDTDDTKFVENEVRLSDEAHSAITRRRFGIDWRQPEHYDLVLNTERLSMDECVDEVEDLLDDPGFQESGESMQALANFSLEARVRAALRQDPRTRTALITIAADRGRVTLSGILEPGLELRDVLEVAASVAGAKDITNDLRVAGPMRTLHIDG